MRKYDSEMAAGRPLNPVLKNPREHILSVRAQIAHRVVQINYGQHCVNWRCTMWWSDRRISSVQFSCSVVSDSLWPHEPQHTRPPCLSPIPGVYPNPCPLSPWCHPAISSSVIPFSFCPQSFPASGSFQISQFFTSDGQSIGVSASASVLPMNT